MRLNDDKYDIHGIYAVDATWDRGRDGLSLVQKTEELYAIRQNGRKPGDKIIKEYDALTLYNCFLIPYED